MPDRDLAGIFHLFAAYPDLLPPLHEECAESRRPGQTGTPPSARQIAEAISEAIGHPLPECEPSPADYAERRSEEHACLACPAISTVAVLLHHRNHGYRWLDLCAECHRLAQLAMARVGFNQASHNLWGL